jgi:hypothetical protein
MFKSGFEKTGGVVSKAISAVKKAPEMAGRGIGHAFNVAKTPLTLGRKVIKGQTATGKALNKGFADTFGRRHSPSGKEKPRHGATLAKYQRRVEMKNVHRKEPQTLRHAAKGLQGKEFSKDTKQSLMKAHASQAIKDRKEKAKPSFAKKHPYITAGAGYLAARQIYKEDTKQEEPRIVYPQQ